MKIIPAVLTESSAELKRMLSQAESFTSAVQLDIMDGKFVPSTSVSPQDLMQIETSLNIEVHLMVFEPERYLSPFKAAGAQRIIFHYEATDNPQRVIDKARQLELKVGIALNPETPVEIVEPLLPRLDCLLFLSVDPGFYGSPFIPEAAAKLWQFKSCHPEVEVGIDGGIKAWNLRRLEAFGVDYACIGSAIFGADPAESYRNLDRLLLRPPMPDFKPTSPQEELLFQLLNQLRHSPDQPDWEEQDRLIVSPEFEPALARVLEAFNYAERGKPFWVEIIPQHPLGRARDLALLLRQKGSDVLIYSLLSPQVLDDPETKDAAEAASDLKLNSLRVIAPGGKPPSGWHRVEWKIIEAPISGLKEALDEAQRSWENSSLMLIS